MEKSLMIILDGFGLAPKSNRNAISAARTPFIDSLFASYPHCKLSPTGLDVGLPAGIMGNSEVGHLNFGAGRIVYQLSALIDRKIEDGDFFSNQVLLEAIESAKSKGGKVHLFGLLSDGGVHSSLGHLWALLRLCKKKGLDEVYYHAFLDGRDTSPTAGLGFIQQFIQKSQEIGIGKIASLVGRYYAMDRDNRWERIQKAYDALVWGIGENFASPIDAINASYGNKITDEFVLPKIIVENNKPIALVDNNDSIVFFNFRSDRAREISRAFILPGFPEFPIKTFQNLNFVSLTEYDINFANYLNVAIKTPKMTNILGEWLSKQELKQLRLAETEKYAHVTFFFNGGVEKPFENEDRILVPSPRIASYDLQPEMSAFEVKDKALENLRNKSYDFILINFANCDMVGHTGDFRAAVKAVETVDKCLSEILPLAIDKGYNVFVTADHGNADEMLTEEGNVMTAHSMNKVPLIFILNDKTINRVHDGKLGDVAPTILKVMKLAIPDEMTGNILID